MNVGRNLDNPAYTGDIVYSDVRVIDAHKALLDRETWLRVRDTSGIRADHRAAIPSFWGGRESNP
nr:recombinase family protein [Actinoplanes solisilvae]